MLALPWGGTSHPVWFRRDPRVANVKVLGGLFDRGLMQGVPAILAAGLEQAKDMEPERASAPLPNVHVLLRVASNYKQTGLLQAYAAHHLTTGKPALVGMGSA